MPTKKETGLSILIPVKNEAQQLDALFANLIPVLKKTKLTWEILFINDGSTDKTLELLLKRRKKDKRIKIMNLSRNFGKEAALSAGLNWAQGKAVITMDADGQHQPSLILEFIRFWKKGFDMVVAQQANRWREGIFRTLAIKIFYRLFNAVSDTKLIPHAGDFRLFDRKVIEAYRLFDERNRFNKGIFALLGFKQKIIQRAATNKNDVRATKWSFGQLFNLAFDALFSFSKFPLRLWLWLGFITILFSLGILIYIVAGVLLEGKEVPGYASLITMIILMGGVNMLGIGIVGEYLYRTFTEAKQRPLYLIEKIYQ